MLVQGRSQEGGCALGARAPSKKNKKTCVFLILTSIQPRRMELESIIFPTKIDIQQITHFKVCKSKYYIKKDIKMFLHFDQFFPDPSPFSCAPPFQKTWLRPWFYFNGENILSNVTKDSTQKNIFYLSIEFSF